jgi:glycerophosphoryl diester phosphodiesterase
MRILPAVGLLLAGLSLEADAMQTIELLGERFDPTPEGGLPRGWRAAGGAWKVEGGELVGEPLSAEGLVLAPGGPWDDLELAVTARFLAMDGEASWLGLSLGELDESGVEHLVRLRQAGRTRLPRIEYLVRHRGGASLRAGGALSGALELGKPLRLRLQTGGGRLLFWVGDELALDSALARDLRAGGLGLRASSARVAFDDFQVGRLAQGRLPELRVRYGPLRPITVIAHRGASAEAPENTLAALRLGVKQGAHGVEFDVHRSRDGALIIIHDQDLIRTTDFCGVFPDRKQAAVAATDLADIRRLDAGSWKGPDFRGEPVPTLEEGLELLRGKATAVVEIKDKAIGREVARLIRSAGLEDEVFVQSFHPQAIRELREELPGVTTGFLTGDRVGIDEVERARTHLRQAREAGASAVVCDYVLIGPAYLAEMRRRAMAVWVYTVDDPAVQEMLIRLGVDGIITNVPSGLLKLLSAED